MKTIVTHSSPDMDATTSVWLIKKFLPGWEDARLEFVQAGERFGGNALRSPRRLNDSSKPNGNTRSVDKKAPLYTAASLSSSGSARTMKSAFRAEAPRAADTVEIIDGNEVIHVDTGLGPLDHHQTASDKVCAASLTFDFIKRYQKLNIKNQISEKMKDRMDALDRMVKVVVSIDHFKEVFWENPLADYHEFSLVNILDGLKLQKQDQDEYYVEFIMTCLDAILREFENRIWAEKEIKNNGIEFETKFGKGIGFETINDAVIKLAQKMGYVIVVRKDPRKGYVRVKARPSQNQKSKIKNQKDVGIDMTLAYEKLKKMDPNATWYLHVSKKMLLNGSAKNPKMKPTKLGLSDIIRVLEEI